MEDEKLNVRKEIRKLELEYPHLSNIVISYEGSGDSFSDFYETICYLPDNTADTNTKIDIEEGTPINELLWYCIQHSEADFNNDGSRGEITIDLKNKTIELQNYSIHVEEYEDDLVTFGRVNDEEE